MNGAAGPQPALRHRVVAIASSAGGVHSLLLLTSQLPEDFPGAVLIVQHLGETSPPSRLTALLARRCPVPVRDAVDGEGVLPGAVLVCPAGSHMALEPGPRLRLLQERPVNFVRPSADRLFESLARTCGPCAIAVVLSGSGSDGAAGVRAVRSAGGTVIVEDRTTAQFYGMPGAAIETGVADLVLPIEGISGALVVLTSNGCNESN